MKRRCDSCGQQYEPKRSTSKYCGPTCRVRASRGATATPAAKAAATPKRTPAHDDTGEDSDGLIGAVRKELRTAGRVDSALGQASLNLAHRIEYGRETGSAVASLTRELRATLAAATSNAAVRTSPLGDLEDELEKRRQRA